MGRMYSNALPIEDIISDLQSMKENAIAGIDRYLKKNEIAKIFVYDGRFDPSPLPEISHYFCYDIMKGTNNRR